MPAGVHSPSAGVIVHTRAPTTALDAPRSFHSSSWNGCECSHQVVSCATTSSYGWIANGTSTALAATTGSDRVSRTGRAAGARDAPAGRGTPAAGDAPAERARVGWDAPVG